MRYVAKPTEVNASIIVSVEPRSFRGELDLAFDLGMVIRLEDDSKITLDKPVIARYTPVEGDYYVTSDNEHFVMEKSKFEALYSPATSVCGGNDV